MPKTRMLVEFGMGTSLRREDYTEAAIRALKDALWHNSVSMAELFDFPKDSMIIDAEIGVQNPEAAAKAEARGVQVIQNRCPKIEYQRLFGELRMGGFNTGVISSKL